MSSTTSVVLVVVALLVVAAIVVVAVLAKRRKQLQERFGPEYDRAVDRAGGRRPAEQELQERAKRREQLDIRPLHPAAAADFAEQWRQAQEHFVDAPSESVRAADVLVTQVMQERGYPVGEFEQQAADVSVDHGNVVEEYRAARDISLANERGEATTEQLREAMVHYRALFSDLLDAEGTGRDRADR